MPNDVDLKISNGGAGQDCAPCGLHRPVRNAYFDGKMLTARDLTAEQTYVNGMRHLGNMLLEGQGTVCGLKVVQHLQESCQTTHVILKAGMALSCCGQEIVVPEDVTIPVFNKIKDDPDLAAALAKTDEEGKPANDLVISLCRSDLPAEMGPVLISDCCGGLDNQLPARIAEDFGFTLEAVPTGSVPEERTVTQPDLSWVHSINTGDEIPVAVSVDEVNSQVLVGSQGPDDSAHVRVYTAATHSHLATLTGWEVLYDIATPRAGDLFYVSGKRDGDYVIAAYRKQPFHLADPETTARLDGPAQVAVSPVTGAVFSLGHADDKKTYSLRGWSAEQVATDFNTPTFSDSGEMKISGNAADALAPFTAGCPIVEVSQDGKFLSFATRGCSDGVMRLVEVSELLSGGIADLNDQTVMKIVDQNNADVTKNYKTAASLRFSYDGALLHVTTRRSAADGQLGYLAVALSPGGHVQRGAGLTHDLPGPKALMPALHVAPDERWLYVYGVMPPGTNAGREDGRLYVFSTQKAHEEGTAPVADKAIGFVDLKARLSGGAIRERGQQIFVPGTQVLDDDDDDEAAPLAGRVMVVDVDEADIAGLFEEAVEGCRSCKDGCSCVKLVHIRDYIWSEEDPVRMVDKLSGVDGEAEIDNLTYRPLVPSNVKLMEAILEIAARAVDSGPPGPRGRDGAKGNDGAPGTPGTDGENGDSIVEADYDPAIDEPVIQDTGTEHEKRLLLPYPIEAVVFRDETGVPKMGTPGGNEERTLILPEPVSGPDPVDPAKFQFVRGQNWKHGEAFALGQLDPKPPTEMAIELNMPASNPEVLFSSFGSLSDTFKDALFWSGVMEVRVHLHGHFLDPESGKIQPFDLGRANSLRYPPPVKTMKTAFKQNQTLVLQMGELWGNLENLWAKQGFEPLSARARVEFLLHGHFLRNEEGFPFDGRAEPDVSPEIAGRVGGTWRSWIEVLDTVPRGGD